MNRRGFLKLFAGLAVAETISKTYFIAPIGGWHSGVIGHPGAKFIIPGVPDYVFKSTRIVFEGTPPIPVYVVETVQAVMAEMDKERKAAYVEACRNISYAQLRRGRIIEA